MGQITIYLDTELESRLKAAARQADLSTSRWIALLVQERLSEEWPAAVRESAGTWGEFPSAEELRSSLGEDEREQF